VPDWREQPIQVQGVARRLGDVHGGRLFHGTTAIIQPGDVIEPGHRRNFKQSARDGVSITSVAADADYWARQLDDGDEPRVYEVEPLNTVQPWRVSPANYGQNITLYEARVSRARVVREVPTQEWQTFPR
jgi:hypothetical protein